MSQREEILALLRAHKPDLQSRYPISSLGLFGSFARNEATDDSDVDILIDFNAPIGWEIVDLVEEMETFLKKKVDLVLLPSLRPRIFQYINKDLCHV